MKYTTLMMCICSIISVIMAALIETEILPPIDPIDLSVGLLVMIAAFLAYVATDISRGETNGEDQEQDR